MQVHAITPSTYLGVISTTIMNGNVWNGIPMFSRGSAGRGRGRGAGTAGRGSGAGTAIIRTIDHGSIVCEHSGSGIVAIDTDTAIIVVVAGGDGGGSDVVVMSCRLMLLLLLVMMVLWSE